MPKFESGGANADATQCGGIGVNEGALDVAKTADIFFDMDDRKGGCSLNYAILDPGRVLKDVNFAVTLGGNKETCGASPKTQEIPVSKSRDHIKWSNGFWLDADSRGTCTLSFRVLGKGPVGFQYEYSAGGAEADPAQCIGAGSYIVMPGQSRPLTIATDNRRGGCLLKQRLFYTPG